MINITARGFELRKEQKESIAAELKRVEKMLPQNALFDVTLTSRHGSYQCDITVKDMGCFIRGEAAAKTIYASIDFAVDDLKRKLRKLKTNLVHKKRKAGIDTLATAMGELDSSDDTQEAAHSTEVRRRKNVVLQMMTEDEAIVQMEMLGHSFYVYLGEDGLTRVIYRRKKGYGILYCD